MEKILFSCFSKSDYPIQQLPCKLDNQIKIGFLSLDYLEIHNTPLPDLLNKRTTKLAKRLIIFYFSILFGHLYH